MNEKHTFWKWLKNNKEWVFSGIGVLILSIIISIVFLSDDSSNSVTTTTNTFGDNADYTGTVEGDKVAGDKVQGDKVAGDKHEGDDVFGNKNVYQATSYRDATVVQGKDRAVIPLANKQEYLPDMLNSLLTSLSKGEKEQKEETEKIVNDMFKGQCFILSGTEVSILESNDSSQGLFGMIKVKALEGPCKDKEGWVLGSLIKTERRPVSQN